MITYKFEIYCNGYEVGFDVYTKTNNATSRIVDKLFTLNLTSKDIRYICLSYSDNVVKFLDDLHVYTEGCGL